VIAPLASSLAAQNVVPGAQDSAMSSDESSVEVAAGEVQVVPL
jgi:hypothetical protein